MKRLILAVLVVPMVAWGQDTMSELWRPREGRSMRATSTAKRPDGTPDPNSNSDNVRVAPGKTYVMADLKGPGIIRHIWMTFLGPEPQPWAPKGAANHREMLLRIYWDGREKPDVEAPVGDFFAAGFGKRMEVKSLPVQVENGGAYNCFWSMPFAKSARIEIVNDSAKEIALLYYNIDWQTAPSVGADTPYFCAQYKQEYPVKKGGDYVIMETEGRGHYVGTVLSVRSRSPEWFGEGDEKIQIDDDEKPSIWGTGTEDYFLCAWGLRECSFPYFGVPFTEPWGTLGGRTCAYRWHVADPIVFQKRIRVAIEHFGWISVDENPQASTTVGTSVRMTMPPSRSGIRLARPSGSPRSRPRPNACCRNWTSSSPAARWPTRRTTATARPSSRTASPGPAEPSFSISRATRTTPGWRSRSRSRRKSRAG